MLCILGPTASGKSALAMQLAELEPRVEIISMDSALVYRGMDIGTAKPTRAELAQARHHLIDLIDPTESYSAARFVRDAQAVSKEVRARGGIPILVGGTMLYYKAYVEGLDDLPSAPPEFRQAIAARAAVVGWPALHQELSVIDPPTAERLKPTDAQRISRALELFQFTGKAMSELIHQSGERVTPNTSEREALDTIALEPRDRAMLHARIAERFHTMLAQGFLDEVRQLMARGDLRPDLPSMRCVGYRQAWQHLSGETTWDEFIAAGIAATRQLAKRQITWLRSFQNVARMDPFLNSESDHQSDPPSDHYSNHYSNHQGLRLVALTCADFTHTIDQLALRG